MTDSAIENPMPRNASLRGPVQRIAKAAAALVVLLAALRVVAFAGGAEASLMQEHLFRLVSFATLTVWMTVAIGIRRRGTAAILVLALASFLELVLLPAQGGAYGTLLSANLGIVIAYCGMQLYWYSIVKPEQDPKDK